MAIPAIETGRTPLLSAALDGVRMSDDEDELVVHRGRASQPTTDRWCYRTEGSVLRHHSYDVVEPVQSRQGPGGLGDVQVGSKGPLPLIGGDVGQVHLAEQRDHQALRCEEDRRGWEVVVGSTEDRGLAAPEPRAGRFPTRLA